MDTNRHLGRENLGRAAAAWCGEKPAEAAGAFWEGPSRGERGFRYRCCTEKQFSILKVRMKVRVGSRWRDKVRSGWRSRETQAFVYCAADLYNPVQHVRSCVTCMICTKHRNDLEGYNYSWEPTPVSNM